MENEIENKLDSNIEYSRFNYEYRLYRIPIIISIILLLFGVIIYAFNKYYTYYGLNYIQLTIALVFEFIGFAILYFIYRKENFRRNSMSVYFLRRYYSYIGISLIFLSLFSFLFSSLRVSEIQGYNIINEIILLLSGVVLVLIMYLTPNERFYKVKDNEINDDKNDVINKSDKEEKIGFEILDSKLEEEKDFERFILKCSKDSEKAEYRYFNLVQRLDEQKNAVYKQANVNLIIGVTIALGGVLALLILVQLNNKVEPETLLAKFNYFSRLTLVIFIEVLAIFFLKLYKENLSDKKYYQNELTNIELKYIALKIAQTNNNQIDLSKVIESLSNTERNFKLGKDESTVLLKQIEFENSFLEKIFSKMNLTEQSNSKN